MVLQAEVNLCELPSRLLACCYQACCHGIALHKTAELSLLNNFQFLVTIFLSFCMQLVHIVSCYGRHVTWCPVGDVIIPLDLVSYNEQHHTAMLRLFGGSAVAKNDDVAGRLAYAFGLASVTPDGKITRPGTMQVLALAQVQTFDSSTGVHDLCDQILHAMSNRYITSALHEGRVENRGGQQHPRQCGLA